MTKEFSKFAKEEQRANALFLYQNGLTFAEIGEQFGITTQYARQLALEGAFGVQVFRHSRGLSLPRASTVNTALLTPEQRQRREQQAIAQEQDEQRRKRERLEKIEKSRESQLESSRKRARARYEAGICFSCDRPRRPNAHTCQPCSDERGRQSRSRYEAFIAKGLCGKCGERERAWGYHGPPSANPDPSKLVQLTMCDVCRNKHTKYKAGLKESA